MHNYLFKRFGEAGLGLVAVLALFVVCIVGGVLFYHYVEGLQPVDAVYFTVMTLTTVGYGDFAPKTDVGKLFTAGYVLLGVTMFLGVAAIIFGTIASRLNKSPWPWRKSDLFKCLCYDERNKIT